VFADYITKSKHKILFVVFTLQKVYASGRL
jgi:hypothetical protein